jgi:pimeloyl-ACP methyl ester carboxylesterase
MAPKSRFKRALLIITLFAIIVILSCVAAYLLCDIEKADLDEKTRARLGGTYISLPDGVTHYKLEGPVQGRPVVLLHGGTAPMFILDALGPDLGKAGFHVLRYDMFGRGRSDRPRLSYDRALHVRQLRDLLDGLKFEGQVDLVGYSFGGAIATAFTAKYPERVRRVALIAPVVKDYKKPKVFAVPVLGEFLVRVLGKRFLVKWNTPIFSGRNLEQYKEQFAYKGFEQAMVSCLRSDAYDDYTREYMVLGRSGKEVLLLWGTEDKDITKEMIDTVRRLVSSVEFHALEGGDHNIVVLRPEEVLSFIVSFLER